MKSNKSASQRDLQSKTTVELDQSKHSIKNFHLSLIRSFLVFVIVFYHIPAWLSFQREPWTNNLRLFDDAFFCLSGFLIFSNKKNRLVKVSQLPKKILNRFIRLYPLHLFGLSLFLFIELIKEPLAKLMHLDLYGNSSNRESLGAFIRHLFLINGWTIRVEYTFNHPAWTWSVLFLCSIISYLIFTTSPRIYARFWMPPVIIVICLIIMVDSATGPFGFAIPRGFYGFFAGAIAANLSSIEFVRARSAALNRILLFLVGAICFYLIRFQEGKILFLNVILFSLFILLVGTLDSQIAIKSKIYQFCQFIEKYAFSIMVFNSFIFYLAEFFVIKFFGGEIGFLRGVSFKPLSNIYGVLIIAASYLGIFGLSHAAIRVEQKFFSRFITYSKYS